jgi:uncharacterized NAD(P)/FAD-binding protein YdhS
MRGAGMSMSVHLEVCIVGAGPRGLSVVERLCANARQPGGPDSIRVHVVDPAAPGAGAVWRPDQSRHLLMNTVASQITVYTDDSVRVAGPIEPGPSLYEWSRSLALLGPLGEHEDDETLAEATELGPNSYPTRAFYGHYLTDSFHRVIDGAPDHVEVRVHRSRAVAMADLHGAPSGPQGVRLEDGTRIHQLDAVVLAQGHVPAQLSTRQERTASLARIHDLTYVTPANPADVDLSAAGPGEPVLLRGLGLNFFDHMALLTEGRGGSFVRTGDRVEYRPSGREPKLFASSRRGVPYHARGENEKGAYGRYYPRVLTAELAERLRPGSEDEIGARFSTDLWPLIAREVESVYYGTLLRSRGRETEADVFVDRYLSISDGFDELFAEYGIDPADRWDWDRVDRPFRGREFADRDDFHRWLLRHLAHDVREARAGNVSGPVKAALDVLRDLRNEVRLAVDHGGLEGHSHQEELRGWFTPFNAYLSIGPPASRIEEMIALIEAGVLEVLGPGMRICVDTVDPSFVAVSTVVPGPPVRARVLIEARLPEPDLRATADPLLRHLMATGQCRTYRIPGSSGTSYETGGLAVTERPYRVLDGQDRAHPRRFAYGVPTEAVHWVTAAGTRPGVDSVTLGDSDAIARAVLELRPARQDQSVTMPASRTSGMDTDITLTGVIV